MSVVKRMLPAALLAAGSMLFATAPAAQAQTSSVSAQAAACSASGYPGSCLERLSATKYRLYVYWGSSYVGFGELTRNGTNNYHLMVCHIGVSSVGFGIQVGSGHYYDGLGGSCYHRDFNHAITSWRGVVAHEGGASYTRYYAAP